MKHVYWIEEGWLAGRPGPNCRQWDLMELYQGGFRAIVSLEETDPREILGAGFEHLMLLIPGCTVPGMEAMEEFCRYVEAKLGEGKPVLVHCHYGEGRTGTMLASWCRAVPSTPRSPSCCLISRTLRNCSRAARHGCDG